MKLNILLFLILAIASQSTFPKKLTTFKAAKSKGLKGSGYLNLLSESSGKKYTQGEVDRVLAHLKRTNPRRYRVYRRVFRRQGFNVAKTKTTTPKALFKSKSLASMKGKVRS